MTDTNDTNFVVECSDDDNYDNKDDNYRVVSGKRVWEPRGEQIAALYRQLEAKGFIELRWQCPGRRSPSVHNIAVTAHHKTNESNESENSTQSDAKNSLLNEFDFDNELGSEPQTHTKPGQTRKRLTSGVKKSQANLNKVMMDIKKYQFVDQTRRLSIQTTSPVVTTQTTSQSTADTQSQNTTVSSGQTPTSQPSVTSNVVIKTEPFVTTIEAKTPTSEPSVEQKT